MHLYIIKYHRNRKIKKIKIDTEQRLSRLLAEAEDLLIAGYQYHSITGFGNKAIKKQLSTPLTALLKPEETLYNITNMIQRNIIAQDAAEQLLTIIFKEY